MLSPSMKAAGDIWLNRAIARLRDTFQPTLPGNGGLWAYYFEGVWFLKDFMDDDPVCPSKFDAVNRARAIWAREEREASEARIDF